MGDRLGIPGAVSFFISFLSVSLSLSLYLYLSLSLSLWLQTAEGSCCSFSGERASRGRYQVEGKMKEGKGMKEKVMTFHQRDIHCVFFPTKTGERFHSWILENRLDSNTENMRTA